MSEDVPAYEVEGQPVRYGKYLEPKYSFDVNANLIFNRQTGKAIPEDEPVMIFRAQDANFPDLLCRYFLSLPSVTTSEREHRLAVSLRLAEICRWQANNPLRVKTPDTIVDESWD